MRYNSLLLLIVLLLSSIPLISQTYKIVESNNQKIVIEFNFYSAYTITDTVINGEKFSYFPGSQTRFGKPGNPWLPDYSVNIGVPYNTTSVVKILSVKREKISNKIILPLPDTLNQPFNQLNFNQKIYGTNKLYPQEPVSSSSEFIFRYINIMQLHVAPVQYDPLSREVVYNQSVKVEIDFNPNPKSNLLVSKISDNFTKDFLKSGVINYKQSLNFIGKIENLPKTALDSSGYWYNPQKDYFKIYLNRKGLYRVTYDWLIQNGVPANTGLQDGNLEIINNGITLPIDIVDVNNNGIFDSGDYFQFIGDRPQPTTQYTYFNIYNNENVYWFSYQADTVYKYSDIDGYPHQYFTTITSTLKTLHFEKDLTYQNLGYAPTNLHRDYWLWSAAVARNHLPYHIFTYWVQDSLAKYIDPTNQRITLRANMQGLTYPRCTWGHVVRLKINGYPVDTLRWNDQQNITDQRTFTVTKYLGNDTIPLYGNQNKFEAEAQGNVCDTAGEDISLMNWFELSFWRLNEVNADSFMLKSPVSVQGAATFKLWHWNADNMKIYIPSRGELIANPYITLDADKDVFFNDTVQQVTEYYCYANNRYFIPDSIKHHNFSDLRNTSNGADYIIITNPKFESYAQQLAEFRSHNLHGFDNPRVKIVDVNQIYDEFSYGLLNPYALQDFVKYAFDNWNEPAPSYVVLLGDMSSDYRSILSTSKPNYVPSVPYQVYIYGQAQSDNLIAAVSGNDLIPDLAIGRISCETTDQANILINKIVNYPSDYSKDWKQNVLLLASGLNLDDERKLGFNRASNTLQQTYLDPNGFHVSKVFNFPDNPADEKYKGGGPEMRQQIDNGAAFVNYYGHGGGGQWDLVFHNDDIYELHNGGRLPVVSSVTCYTAHFDNQDAFGEIFDRVENKGSIAFIGSSALTWWPAGAVLDSYLFNEIFTEREYVLGKAFMNAKIVYGSGDMTVVTTLLGDPALTMALPTKPDFNISSSDISFKPTNPLKGDTIKIKANIHNLGVTFPGQEVYVQFYKNIVDSTNLIGELALPSFGELDSAIVSWIPENAALYSIIVEVNNKNVIDEEDRSDNSAVADIAVFDFGEPNIIAPINGFFTNQGNINFKFWDIGQYFNKNLNYLITIDTSTHFNSNLKIISPVLTPQNGILKWQSPNLTNNNYYWEATIFDIADTNTSSIKFFSVGNQQGNGYIASEKQLKLFDLDNINYSDSLHSLILNTDLIPPHPDINEVQDSIVTDLTSDSTKSTTFTTDGTYMYYADLAYFTNGNPTKIYRVGTGNNGTIKGYNYGPIPNFLMPIDNQIFYYNDGYIYTPAHNGVFLIKINLSTGDTSHVYLPVPLLKAEYGILRDGDYYTASDGRYVYNLSNGYDTLTQRYTLRVYDPQNNWMQVGSDKTMNGSSAYGFSSFFVLDGYLFTYESYSSGYMRRYKISTGTFEEEWLAYSKELFFSSWTYDWSNNFVYGLRNMPFRANRPGFYKFLGMHQQASGSIISQDIGPAYQWNDITYNLDQTGSQGHFVAYLLGKNQSTNVWDTLKTNLPAFYSLSSINAKKYGYLKIYFSLVDTALGADEPMKLKSVKVNYIYPPEIGMFPSDISLENDTLLQGIPDKMKLKIHNYGYSPDDSVLVSFYLNDSSAIFYSKLISLPVDSTKEINYSISTDSLVYTSGISTNKIKAIATTPYQELFSFNNIIQKNLYVSRDSLKPIFDITFDGKEIINGDVVRSKPVILMTLKDNSPLPLDTSFFTIVYDNNPLNFSESDIKYTSTAYPNSEFFITWTPKLPDGTHTLQILAKDASGNFFDSTAKVISFVVSDVPTLKNVYNYPNPFKNDTYFTCEFGSLIPDEFYIKIFTIAGRLIKDLSVPTSELVPGFNKIYWNGRDADGDQLANGLYIYKVVAKIGGEVKTVIQKMAKVQ